jgi:hypothetical protein
MQALAVVPNLDILEDRPATFGARAKMVEIYQVFLDQAVPGFDTRIIPAAPLPAHAGGHAVAGEPRLVSGRGVLATAVRVMQHPGRGTMARDRPV